MKKALINLSISFLLFSFCASCQTPQKKSKSRNIHQDFTNYWYAGKAEISTYKLSQNRYGQLRTGTSTLIFVTEEFLPKEQVKADNSLKSNIPILKLNSTKKFNTGIYPYSIMQSCFTPVYSKSRSLKATASIQEWCGQTYIQVNNRKGLQIESRSYFASEGDKNIKLPEVITENEIWNLIRLSGTDELPIGEFEILPALEYIRLSHITIKPYKVTGSITQGDLNTYTLIIPELKRTLKISFQPKFPYIIERWSEEVTPNKPTIATRITTKLLPYWNMNNNSYEPKRKEFGLK